MDLFMSFPNIVGNTAHTPLGEVLAGGEMVEKCPFAVTQSMVICDSSSQEVVLLKCVAHLILGLEVPTWNMKTLSWFAICVCSDR